LIDRRGGDGGGGGVFSFLQRKARLPLGFSRTSSSCSARPSPLRCSWRPSTCRCSSALASSSSSSSSIASDVSTCAFGRYLFDTEALSLSDLLYSTAVATAVFVSDELRKFFQRGGAIAMSRDIAAVTSAVDIEAPARRNE
jgi:hypothetical protein